MATDAAVRRLEHLGATVDGDSADGIFVDMRPPGEQTPDERIVMETELDYALWVRMTLNALKSVQDDLATYRKMKAGTKTRRSRLQLKMAERDGTSAELKAARELKCLKVMATSSGMRWASVISLAKALG